MMQKLAPLVAAALLAAGCTAAGAQSLTAPTLTQLAERIDKQDTKIASLETDLATARADVKTAGVRAKTAKAHAVRAEALHERAAARIDTLEAQLAIETWAHSALHDDFHDFVHALEGREYRFTFDVHVPATEALTITLPQIDGLTWSGPTSRTWAAGTRQTWSPRFTVPAGTYGPDDPEWHSLWIEPTVTLGDRDPVGALGRVVRVRNTREF